MSHSGAATFKKVSGIITINEDVSPAQLIWRSTTGDKTHTISLETIDKLQATPPKSEKMMLRLIAKLDPEEVAASMAKKIKDNDGNEVPAPAPKPVSHMFSFNNRDVMDNIKLTLQQIISRYKDIEQEEERRRTETPLSTAGLDPLTVKQQQQQQLHMHLQQSQTQLINTAHLDDSLSKKNLLLNLKLQQSLLKNNKDLMKTFQETVIYSGLPPEEFWSTRIPLLRAFALSMSQKVGPYNVLSTIKPVASSENKVNVNLSRQKILSIFETYPIVKKAYDDNVPKNFKEQEFWARFFSSKLFRKLRGEKLMANDRGDVIIDRYLTLDQEYDRKDDERLSHPVTKFIDIEANREDDPVKLGHRPDFTMRPGVDVNGNSDGTIDILKGMNRLSEKMIMALENEYSRSNVHQENSDQQERESVEILDLEKPFEADYAVIHLNDKEKEHSLELLNKTNDDHSNGTSNESLTPEIISKHISNLIADLSSNVDLTSVMSESNENKEINRRVIQAVKINAKQTKYNHLDPMLGTFIGRSDEDEARSDLPVDLLESCRMLHSTCCEFLKHFYIHFQSGEYKRGILVNKLYKHLKDCSKKLKELFDDVLKEDGEAMAQITTAYLKPILDSVMFAIAKYDKAFAEFNKVAPPSSSSSSSP